MKADPYALRPLPDHIVRRCTQVPGLRSACPTMVPDAAGPLRSYEARLPGLWGFVVAVGDPTGTDVPGPLRAMELEVVTGEGIKDPVRPPKQAPTIERAERWRGRPWLLDDDVTWAGRTGRLILWPDQPGTPASKHVSFDWRERGDRYRISLRTWDPVEQSVATLREVVETAGAGRG